MPYQNVRHTLVQSKTDYVHPFRRSYRATYASMEHMSLTTNDLDQIRTIIESALSKQTNDVIKPIQGKLEVLRNDIKDIYDMLAEMQKNLLPDSQFQNLTLEQKLLRLNTELLDAAKQAGISLPR